MRFSSLTHYQGFQLFMINNVYFVLNFSCPQSKFPSPLLIRSKKLNLLGLRFWSICPLHLFLPTTQLMDIGGSLTLGNVIRVPLVQSKLYKYRILYFLIFIYFTYSQYMCILINKAHRQWFGDLGWNEVYKILLQL